MSFEISIVSTSYCWRSLNDLPSHIQNDARGSIKEVWDNFNEEASAANENGRHWIKIGVYISGSILSIAFLAKTIIPFTPLAASAAFVMPYMAPLFAITTALSIAAGLLALQCLDLKPPLNGIVLEKTESVDNPAVTEALKNVQEEKAQLEKKKLN